MRHWLYASTLTLFTLCLFACKSPNEDTLVEKQANKGAEKLLTLETEVFGSLPDGREVYRYTLSNKDGMQVKILSFGGILQSIIVPDKDGNLTDVVLGFDDFDSYYKDQRFFGPIVGRFSNRIAFGKYTFEGEEVQLDANRKGHHLHGGSQGFHKVLWEATTFEKPESVGVTLRHFSPAGANGYPGNFHALATYSLNKENELEVIFQGTTDAPTPVNMTSHSYFNLAGQGSIDSHLLEVSADHYTPVNDMLIPTGEITAVANTPLDFTQAKTIGQDIAVEHPQIKLGKGFDHNFVLNNNQQHKAIATLTDPNSGRVLEIHSSQPGLQFYSGNFLDGSVIGKNRQAYEYRTGIVLEAQHYPDSPNHANFPNTILRPGETYENTFTLKFSVQ